MSNGMTRRLNRRNLLGKGLGLATTGTLMAAHASSVGASKANASEVVPSMVQSDSDSAETAGTVTLRFIKAAGPTRKHDVIFVNEFMADNPNIVVEIEDVVYDELFRKCLALGATDNLADVFTGHN